MMGNCSDCGNKKKRPRVIRKLASIIDGFSNYIWPNPEVEKIALERADICSQCNLNSQNWCVDCGCFVPAKIRSLDETCHKWKT